MKKEIDGVVTELTPQEQRHVEALQRKKLQKERNLKRAEDRKNKRRSW